MSSDLSPALSAAPFSTTEWIYTPSRVFKPFSLRKIAMGQAPLIFRKLPSRANSPTKPPMPFSHAELLSVLNHTLWFLPSVASCFAMRNLLKKKQNVFYKDYKVVVAAGSGAGGQLPVRRRDLPAFRRRPVGRRRDVARAARHPLADADRARRLLDDLPAARRLAGLFGGTGRTRRLDRLRRRAGAGRRRRRRTLDRPHPPVAGRRTRLALTSAIAPARALALAPSPCARPCARPPAGG